MIMCVRLKALRPRPETVIQACQPTITMKSVIASLSFVCVALAIPFFSAGDNGQLPLALESLDKQASYPGFDLDLNQLRLVQLEGKEPVWMTELEKVRPILSCNAQLLTDCTLLDSSESSWLPFLRHVRGVYPR